MDKVVKFKEWIKVIFYAELVILFGYFVKEILTSGW
jgi:hypothetical protein|tara:strand:- start:205 stop:312 length:108 start_codon:yes stop_codon:yes gene_type:complete